MVFVACEFETGTELDADEELEVVAGMELDADVELELVAGMELDGIEFVHIYQGSFRQYSRSISFMASAAFTFFDRDVI